MSGLCATGAGHHLCHVRWETPSVYVTCKCECHEQVEKKIVAKKSAKVLVPKK